MTKNKTFYLTTPIYYVNAKPHIGHSYTSIASDTIVRFKRLFGYDTYFLTGTDEHGGKLEKAAAEKNMTPKDYTDIISKQYIDIWEKLNISYDRFIRTTENIHLKTVRHVFSTLLEKGDIYKDFYEGWYCTPCETYYNEDEMEDFKCPDCGRKVEMLKEESYFFALSKYQDKLKKYYDDNPETILPKSRFNEVYSFIDGGLKDLSISRTTVRWGIHTKEDSNHTIYVWFDALLNYISGIGYLDDKEKFNKFWPADMHIIGKDIIKFHCVIWPAILMSLGVELPKLVFNHGWWTSDGEKMSKSKGNFVDPYEVIEKVPVDSFRYFVLREVTFGLDGDFSYEKLIKRHNNDLVNDLGNLYNRVSNMVFKYQNGKTNIPSDIIETDFEKEIKTLVKSFFDNSDNFISKCQFHNYLNGLFEIIRSLNKYIDSSKPWTLYKENNFTELNKVLYFTSNVLIICGYFLYPVMPDSAEKIFIHLDVNLKDFQPVFDEIWMKHSTIKYNTKKIYLFERIQ